MKAVVYSAPREYQITDIPVPEPGRGDVRIRCRQVGLCGTDVHIHNGEFMAEFPLTPGHELDGTVDALGDDVTGLAVGEQVTVNPNVHCGLCEYCRAGRLILCENLKGMGSNYPGFFAEYVTVPAALVFSTEGLAPDVAVFSEPAACAMHGLENLGVRPGSSALVLGAGPTGLLLAQFIASGGAASVTVAAPTSHKLETAAGLGLDRTVLITRGDPDASLTLLRDASPAGDGYDYVVEATGSAEVGAMCVPLTRNGGTVLVYGVTGHADTVAFHPFDVFRREITIKGSFAEITSFAAAIAALKGGRARTDGIITHRFGLDEYPAALAAVASGTGVHKVVIECS